MMDWKLVVVIGLLAVVAGCSGVRETQNSSVIDLNDGDTYTLSAGYITRPIGGKQQRMLAYNKSIPGPTIRVKQGAEITINFTNDTDVTTLLHSHGVRMDNAFDGSQLQQKEMRPGESFTYKLRFDDAGIYWYHPHANEVFGQGLGLYGAFIVTPAAPQYFPPVNREVPLFIADIPMNSSGIALSANTSSHSLMGHYGDILLLNGEEEFSLEARPREVIRLYIINAANARPFNFAVKDLQLKLVGGDNGAYERASFVSSVILAPSERAIVDVFLPDTGTYEIENRTPDKTYHLGKIVVSGRPPEAGYETEFRVLDKNDTTFRSMEPFRNLTPINIEPDKRISLTLNMSAAMMDHAGHVMETDQIDGGIEWEDKNKMMNSMSSPGSVTWKLVDRDSGKENMDIVWSFRQNTPVKIRIFNDPASAHPMQHPIHFHGQKFLVAARDGVIAENLVWKDTVLIKAGETVDIILDTSNPGTWMAHCHISEHLEAGMAMTFEVLP